MDYDQQQLSTEQSSKPHDNIDKVPNEKWQHSRKALPFKEFDLEIDYVDSLSFEVEYYTSKDQTSAAIHEIDQEKIVGEKALNQLTPHFMELSFDQDSTEEEVIDDVIHVFGLDDTYKEFKLRVIYNNGNRAVYED
ncbi:YusW-like protein [Halobacillus karajensis]|uniref:YusW family protein n=1 Tax=Halobacillus karajensis TaxID=195088 RepID=UPI0008A7821F|nr:YusW family protein [Halobacillus karajensis]SEH79802.1 YusW-like protein [Halobacillus karajensis]